MMSATAEKHSVEAIPGYRVYDKIYQSNRIIVYRAVRERDKRRVILKLLHQNFRGPEDLSRHRHEYEIVSHLKSKGATLTCDIDVQGRVPMLIFEDFGGESLRKLAGTRRFTLVECLAIGIKIADALAAIHADGVIHKDINPSNVVYNRESDELKIIDFGLSTSLAREQPAMGSPDVLEGTLAYISPEQTGRMNRSVDYRSDFYSFGVTLYELLTGKLPFDEADPLTLMHAHMAKQPASPSSCDASIPAPLSALVMKLLEKTAEDRYQSALGIKRDLEECLRQINETGTVVDFPLARFDVSDRLKPSQCLYGRESEIAALLAAFERAASGGREIVMVTGYSGIGKTSVVRELYKPITARRGYFIAGKFDQLQRNVPYKAIINAFQELTRQLLGENEAKLAAWKEKLLGALGANGQIIIDIIPEMELIVGPQPRPVALDPVQEQNRFNLVFASFVRVFCKVEHPLTIYLDDLQWIDPASLKLLLYLLGDPSLRHLFFVGAYRDNEVDAVHPLTDALERLKKTGVVIHTMQLKPLAQEHVRQMVADTLCMESSSVEPLAALIVKKTGGNPFFAEEFLKSLYADGLLSFDQTQRIWRWDLDRIETQNSTDNVVDLMVARLKRLDPQTQKVLQFAACIGNQFEVGTLAVIYQQPVPLTMAALRQAIVEEMVIPLGTSLSWSRTVSDGAMRIENRFAHDRIQHAAYSLIPSAERQAAHLEIGRLLLRDMSEENRQEQLFEIVNQLNLGIALITDSVEKDRLIELNLEAGRKARRSNAYDAALGYFQAAIALLGEDGWTYEYELTLTLHTEAARAAFLSRRLEESDRLVDAVLARAKTLLDKIEAYGVRLEALMSTAKLREAAELGLSVLKSLGASFPTKPSRLRVMLGYYRLRLSLLFKSHRSLLSAPPMRDPQRLAEMQILSHVLTAAFFTMPSLSPLLIFRVVRNSAKYGNTPYSVFAYASYGAFLCIGPQRMVEGREFGELALALLERMNAVGLKAKVLNLVYAHINLWSVRLRTLLPPLQEGIRVGIETGDLEYASLCGISYVVGALQCGIPLSDIEKRAKEYARVAKGASYDSIVQRRQMALNLLGNPDDPCRLQGDAFDEDKMLPRLVEGKRVVGLLTYYTMKSLLTFLFGRLEEAEKYAGAMKKYMAGSLGTANSPTQFLLQALIALARCSGESVEKKKQAIENVDRILAKLNAWAHAAPMNLLQHVYLIEAERLRVLGLGSVAAERYDRAIACAKKEEYLFEEALAYELAGKFHLEQDRTQFAYGYLREARDAYARWGAVAKVKQMESVYPGLIQEKTMLETAANVASTVTGSFSMDLKALMRALKDIGSEQVHSHLLEKTIMTAMEVAGAQNALLFLRDKDEGFSLEAEANIGRDKPDIMKSVPLAACRNASISVINYASRTKQTVVIHDAQKPQSVIPGLNDDPYVKSRGVKSILCVPLLNGAANTLELIGLLYLENNAATHTFVERVREPLEIICLSAAARLELSRKAVMDLLTNLYNHDYMQGILQKETASTARTGRKLSLIMIDIDYFKKFNDNHGHQAGDLVLSRVAALIKSGTRQSDVVARYGGEEMAVVLPDTDGPIAREVAERIRRSIETAVISYENKALRVTASLGIATFSAKMSGPADLVKAADEALYRSKHDGRNRVTVAGD